MECADDSCTDEVLEGQLFCIKHLSQITAIEDLQCPSGCGRLSYGRVGWSGQFWAIIIAAGATTFISIYEVPWLILLAIPLAVLAFASNEGVTGRYKCDKCLGEMYDSKTMVETMSTDKATTIERLLESGTPSPNKRQCPRCEEGMVRISIDYVEPDRHGGGGDVLGGIVVAVVAAMIPNPTKHLDMEGCQTCGTFWFDSGELTKIKGSESMKGRSYTPSETPAGHSYRLTERSPKKRQSGKGGSNQKPTHCTFIDPITGRKCNTLPFRGGAFCWKHK